MSIRATTLLLALALAGAGGLAGRGAQAAPSPSPIEVFAAASLTEAFTALGKIFEAEHPGERVTFNFAGSQQLALQIEQGARADLFASADQRWMAYLKTRGLLLGDPVIFAANRLVFIVPRSNPGKISGLADLARPGLKIVVAADAVPAGHYLRQALARLSMAPGFSFGFGQQVLGNVVSEEENVKAVVAKVQLGEADAGGVYRSDVTSAVSDKVTVLDIPDPYNVIAAYPMAILARAQAAEGARDFGRFIVSPLGQQTLRGFNFLPPP